MTDNLLRSPAEVSARIADGQFQGCVVQEVDLSREGLAGARAVDVNMRRVALHDADATRGELSRVKFSECSCRGVRFDGSRLRGTSFFNSELIEASFKQAGISGSSFFNVRLGNADFSGTRIQSSTFNGCELFGAKFTRAVVVNSRFEAPERGNVTLDRADFSNAVIIDSDMMGANLFGASFKNALLIKVDLRHANIAQADFEGARLIDVQIDLTNLEPGERRAIESARLDDPWRNHGFMQEVLEPYSDDELRNVLEYVLRTYIIEAAEPTTDADTFQGLLASLKARYDFQELESIRTRNGVVQVRHGTAWFDLGQPIHTSGGGGAPASADTGGGSAAPAAPAASGDSAPGDARGSEPPRRRRGPDFDMTPAPKDNKPPKRVGTSKRFKKLEMD